MFISRLRSIERKAVKLSQVQLVKRKREVAKLIKYLELRLETDKIFEQLEVRPIVEQALQILRTMKDTRVNSVDVINNVGPLLDLNRFWYTIRRLLMRK